MSDISTMAAAAKIASRKMAVLDKDLKNNALKQISEALTASADRIFEANREDVRIATEQSLETPLLKRLKFDEKKLKEVTLKINTEEYFPIDKPIETDIVVDFPKKAMELYKRMQRDLFVELASGTEVESPNAAAMTMRCLQIAGGALYTGDDQYEEIHNEKISNYFRIIVMWSYCICRRTNYCKSRNYFRFK